MAESAEDTAQEGRPPQPPWRAFADRKHTPGYVSYYLSDDLARWPVRAVTRIKDNKSDPNLETGTYGLFSTCEQKMRSGIVASGARHLFFVTRRRGGGRELTGMYELGWWAPGSLHKRTRDFALAASAIRFIDPLALQHLPGALAERLSGKWRLFIRLDACDAVDLARHVRAQPDMTPQYLAEIDRVERVNRFYAGYRYPTWRRKDPWSWADSARYLRTAAANPDAPKIRNSSPTGWWKCCNCAESTENGALLKACPHCHELDTLRPLNARDLIKQA